ncbi:SpaA isopeptide-forming pilin-related protein, partial [Cellulomonas sp. 179-A 4D5 NHS]|uniref:N-acetylmuramoyl-L-alanine amidase n=1 Tax=Cellulomonas sp. 179-A 4D5 NHS TaxID=3142378 RepID=UPI0039A33739
PGGAAREAAPDATAEVASDAGAQAAPDATAEAAPGATAEAAPGASPEATPGSTPQAQPDGTSEAAPQETPEAAPDATPATPDTATDRGSSGTAAGTVVADEPLGADRVETEVIESDGFSLVGLTWPEGADVSTLDPQVRTRDGDVWSSWSSFEPADETPDPGTADAAGTRDGTDAVWVGASDAVQVSFAATPTGGPDGLSVSLVDPGADPAGSARTAAGEQGARIEQAGFVAASAAVPGVVSRAEWGAPATTPCAPDSAQRLVGAVVHHSASTNAYASQAEARAAIRGFYAYHTESRGWCDIGYNFLVDKWGTVYEGRAGSMTGAVIGVHAGGFNTGTMGVSMIGDYSSVTPSAATLEGVSSIIAWRLAAYGADPQGSMSYHTLGGENSKIPANTTISLPVVFAHRDVASTACPGQQGYAAMGQIRARAAELARAHSSTAQSGQVAAVSGSTPVAGVLVDIRDAQCQQVYSTMRTGADGTFPVAAFPGMYCAVPVGAPAGFGIPSRQTFVVAPGSGFRVELQVPAGPVSGTVVVTGRGAPVAGAVFEVRNASCSSTFSTMRTGSDGTFGVTAYPGTYCLVPVSVPAPLQAPATHQFTVSAGRTFTVPLELASPVTGAVAVSGRGAAVAGAVFEVRNASCSTTFSTMRTGADGTFPVTAYPGTYCLVPVSVPAPFAAPASRAFTVDAAGFRVAVDLTSASVGAVVVTGGGDPVAGAVFEVRNASCSTTFSRMRTGADGRFAVTAYPGTYCLVPVSVPAPFDLPATRTFAVGGSDGFTVPVALTGPVTGAVAVSGRGAAVAGAVFEVRNASCSTTFSTMRTGADGTFPVTAYPGTYCLVPVSVPAPFAAPASRAFTVDAAGFRVAVDLTSASVGAVVVTGGGDPVAGAVFEVRNASCSTTFSRMRTGADGRFAVTAYPGTYCLVPVSVPAPFDPPATRTFTVAGADGFTVPVALTGPSTGSVKATGGGGAVAGAVFEVRNASCTTTFSTMRTGADGTFPVTAYPGTYCLVPVSVPSGFALPARQTFTVTSGQRFDVAVALTRG